MTGVFDLSEACTVTVRRSSDDSLLDSRRFISADTAEAFAAQARREVAA